MEQDSEWGRRYIIIGVDVSEGLEQGDGVTMDAPVCYRCGRTIPDGAEVVWPGFEDGTFCSSACRAAYADSVGLDEYDATVGDDDE